MLLILLHYWHRANRVIKYSNNAYLHPLHTLILGDPNNRNNDLQKNIKIIIIKK